MTTNIRPFKIALPDQSLADLKAKLALTRYPQELTLSSGNEWEYGVPVKPSEPVHTVVTAPIDCNLQSESS